MTEEAANEKTEIQYHEGSHARALRLISQTNCRFSTFIQEKLTSYDLTSQQFNLLRILRGAKEEKVNSKIIRERLVDKNADVSRLIGRLVEKGLIALKDSKSDRRQRWVILTDEGMAKLKTVDQDLPHFPFDFIDRLSEEERETLIEILEKI